MSKTRIQKVAVQIKKEVSDIILNEIKDPRVNSAVTSITDVKVSGDLGYAWIYISVYDQREEAKADTIKALENAKGFIRSETAKRIRLRHIPELHFFADESLEYGAHIESVLKDIIPPDEKDENRNG